MSVTHGLGSTVSENPRTFIVIMIVLTILFSFAGKDFINNADMNAFNPDHELIKANNEVSERFGTEEYSVMVLIKDPDGDLLEIGDMKALIELEAALRADPELGPEFVATPSNPTGFMSIADLLVTSYGLLNSRAGMDLMLTGMNASLSDLVQMLGNPAIPNDTKARAMMATVTFLGENLTAMQGGNSASMSMFDRNASIMALDAIGSEYGGDAVPSFLHHIESYDAFGATVATGLKADALEVTIQSVMPHVGLLAGYPLGPDNATQVLMGLSMALPSMTAGASAIDGTFAGLYFGAYATLTKDFEESGGSKAKGAIARANLNIELDEDGKLKAEESIERIADEHGSRDGLEYGVFGGQLISKEIQESMDFSQMFLLMLVVVLIIIILFITFRNLFDTFLTMLCLGMAIMWSYGISILLGMQGSIIAQVVPILLVGLGVDYGIHMTMRFREEKARGMNNRKATRIAIGTVGMALLLATITTGIGFMSNTISSLSILRDFAYMVTIGIASSFIIMTTFQPAVKYLVTEWSDNRRKVRGRGVKPSENRHAKRVRGRATSFVTAGATAGDKAPGVVILLLLIISGAAGWGALQLDTVFNFTDFVPEGTDAKRNIMFLYNEFNFGEEEYGVVYIKGDVSSPVVLQAMDRTIRNTLDDDHVVQGIPTRSILDVLGKYSNPTSPMDYNQTYLETWMTSDTDGNGIPDRNVKTLYDILYNFEGSHRDLISVVNRSESGEYIAAMIQIRVDSDNLGSAGKVNEELIKDSEPLRDLVDDGTIDKVYVVGGPVVTHVIISEMNAGQVNSIIITIIASGIVLTIVFYALERSFILGLLTTIPIALVILWILGTMYLIGYTLNVMTITIASLTVGMGVTYSIHITERFTEDIKRFSDVGKACEHTLTHTGMALAGAFMTTAGGFGVLFFHKLPPLQQFGVLIALSITYSFLASTYILPTFLILWAKWRKRYRKTHLTDEELGYAPIREEEPGASQDQGPRKSRKKKGKKGKASKRGIKGKKGGRKKAVK